MRSQPYHIPANTKTRTPASDQAALGHTGSVNPRQEWYKGMPAVNVSHLLPRGKHTAAGRIRQSDGDICDGRHRGATLCAVCLYTSGKHGEVHVRPRIIILAMGLLIALALVAAALDALTTAG